MSQLSEATQEHHPPEPPYDPGYPRPMTAVGDPRQKSPFLAGLLSLVPGLGQVYLGYYQRGFVHAVVVAALMSLLAGEDIGALTPLAVIFLVFFWLYNVIDASRRAALYNQALAGMAEIELPEDFKMPAFRGTVLGGLLIAAAGVVLLLHTRFGYSLDWIEEWWPAALIAFGAYLVAKAWQERSRTLERSGPNEIE
jgi:hypothetical protein